jgi:DNA-directed RNA polymerase subunit RPC12/RpoP
MLWPLGGVAYVNPPQRPGATLWSLAAGPLVNVALLPILGGLFWAAQVGGLSDSAPNLYTLAKGVFEIDIILLVFNILPIYPLDGGQILRSLLWFVLGRARSLMVATVVGFVGGAGLVVLALVLHSAWSLLMAGYLLLNCWGGLQSARAMLKIEKMPRREGYVCPGCGAAPNVGEHWKCAKCHQAFDTFASGAVCPRCGAQFSNTMCIDCKQSRPMSEWATAYHASRGPVVNASMAK